MAKKWIAAATPKSTKGALHRALGIPAKQKIPHARIVAAASKGGRLGRMARLALTLAKLRKK